MTRTTAITAVTFGILAFSALSPAFAQDAKAIIAKSAASYNGLKTYQAEVVMEQASPQGKSKTTMSVKKSGANVLAKINSPTPTPMGKNLTALTDGKTITLYMADTNQYIKMPMNPMLLQITGVMPDIIMKQVAKEGTVKKLADSKVNGKAAYVIEGSNAKQPNAPKSKFYIDKSSSRLVKIEGSAPSGGGMGGGNVTLTYRNEKINSALPASTFVFTPPKGAKVMQNPMGGGAPGGGG